MSISPQLRIRGSRKSWSLKTCISVIACAIFSTSQLGLARGWEAVPIPDAYCGNGQGYKVFVDKKDLSDLSVEFMGGGACWDQNTCYGLGAKAMLFALPFVPPVGALMSENPEKSPLSNSTFVYFPYCTGDVFSGTRIQEFGSNKKAYKLGRTNVEKAFKYLNDSGKIPFENVKKLQLVGSSAGAIGALLNAKFIEKLFPADTQKSLLADSPGLHFGNRFWSQLGEHFTTDLFKHLEVFGVQASNEDTTVAKFIPQICSHLPDWNIGFLQASRDIIMSSVFGTTTPKEHEERIYGKDGMWKATAVSADNCASWIPSTAMHTFMLTDVTSQWRVANFTALDFARGVFQKKIMKNYSDRYFTPEDPDAGESDILQ